MQHVLFFILFFCSLSPVLGQSTQNTYRFDPPSITDPVMDEASLLSPRTRAHLNQVLRELYDSGGTQIGVLTIPSLGDLSIEEVGIKTADKWRLGKKGVDDGVVVLIAPNDRKVRIEVGRGREGELTDLKASQLIRGVMTPAFGQGKFDEGVISGVYGLISITDPNFDLGSAMKRSPTHGRLLKPARPIASFLTIFLFFLVVFIRFKSDTPDRIGRGIGRRSRGWVGGSSGGFGSGGFGGGFGGGGGGFGGGGASGSW